MSISSHSSSTSWSCTTRGRRTSYSSVQRGSITWTRRSAAAAAAGEEWAVERAAEGGRTDALLALLEEEEVAAAELTKNCSNS